MGGMVRHHGFAQSTYTRKANDMGKDTQGIPCPLCGAIVPPIPTEGSFKELALADHIIWAHTTNGFFHCPCGLILSGALPLCIHLGKEAQDAAQHFVLGVMKTLLDKREGDGHIF